MISFFATGVIAAVAAVTTVTTSGNVEISAGRLPVSALGSIDTVTTTWSPHVAVGVSSSRTDWVASYAQRIWWREPDTSGRARPFALHLANTSLARRLSRRWVLDFGLSGSAGDLDFLSLQAVLGASQSALPPAVQSVAVNGAANAGLTWQATPRWRLSGSVAASYADDYGEVDVIFRTAGVSSTIRGDFAVSRRVGVGPGLSASYVSLQTLGLLDVRPFVVYSQRFTRLVNARATAGVAVALANNGTGTGTAGTAVTPVSGTLSMGVGIGGPSSPNVRWSHAGEISLAPRADPVLNTYVPSLSTSWGSEARVGTHWTIAPTFVFSTNVSAVAQPGAPFETLGGVRLPVVWQANRHHSLSLVGYAGLRGPHLAALNSGVRPEYTVALGYSYRFGGVSTGSGIRAR